MNSAGVMPKNLHQRWQFGVYISGFDPAYFSKADLPEFEIQKAEFAPAGSLFNQKAAGRVSFEDITLERGVTQDDADSALLDWVRRCVAVTVGTGGLPDDYMQDVDIVQYDRTGAELRRVRLFGAWITKGKLGELDGSSSENTIESITLTYQYFEEA
jgi:phage tail-like protein